jgi:hypothetical protein
MADKLVSDLTLLHVRADSELILDGSIQLLGHRPSKSETMLPANHDTVHFLHSRIVHSLQSIAAIGQLDSTRITPRSRSSMG